MNPPVFSSYQSLHSLSPLSLTLYLLLLSMHDAKLVDRSLVLANLRDQIFLKDFFLIFQLIFDKRMLSLAFHSYFFLKKRREIKNIVFLFFRKVYKPQKHVTPKICHFQLQLFNKQDSFVHPSFVPSGFTFQHFLHQSLHPRLF